MTTDNKFIEELNISNFLKRNKYIIPIYQRNYAWGEEEIQQLLQDILDVANSHPEKSYYIGSLIVYKREDSNFEVIDGQQRHTTLCLIASVLKNLKKNKLSNELQEKLPKSLNLKFDSRTKSDETIKRLFNEGNTDAKETDEQTIQTAYSITENFFLNLEEQQYIKLVEYLLDKVKIIRV